MLSGKRNKGWRRISADTGAPRGEADNGHSSRDAASTASTNAIRERVQNRLLKDLRGNNNDALDVEQVRPELERAFEETLGQAHVPLSRIEQAQLFEEIQADILGYGPIEPLLRDDSVTEILVNGPDKVYVERNGTLRETPVRFRDAGELMRIIDRIVAPLGRRIDESSPMVDARLPDGSRVNVIIPPLALNGPCMSIRKFARSMFSAQDAIRYGTVTQEMVDFFRACIIARLNIVVSGGTSTGKTTFLNLLSSFLPASERIVTIEDAAELRLVQDHVVRLEARPANIEGKGAVPIRQLVINALRMRPDRIIVGEVRGGEALDMLQAMNTGHDGSLTTAHSNSPRDTLHRVETMVLMAGTELPLRAIREQIASAFDLVIHLSRLSDGTRRVMHVTEVMGMEEDTIVMQEIFQFKRTGLVNGRVEGYFTATGVRPRLMDKIETAGIRLPQNLFVPSQKP